MSHLYKFVVENNGETKQKIQTNPENPFFILFAAGLWYTRDHNKSGKEKKTLFFYLFFFCFVLEGYLLTDNG